MEKTSHIRLINSFFLPFPTHFCMLQVWDGCRPGGCTRLLKPPFASLHKQMLYPSSTPRHTHEHSRSNIHAPEYATRFITIKVSPKRHWNALNHFARSLELRLICYLLPRALGKTKTATAQTLERAYCSCCPQVSAPTGWNKTITVKLARQQTENTLIQFETRAYLLKYKCLNW